MLGSVPGAVPRIALEVIFLIVVAAVVAVAEFSPLEIVAVMGGAALLVLLVELLAGRERRASTPIPAEAPAAAELSPPSDPARRVPAPAPPQSAVPAPDASQPTTGELSLVPVPDLPEKDEPIEGDEVGGWAPFAEPAGAETPSVMAALAVEDELRQDEVEEEPVQDEESPLPEPVAEAREPDADLEPQPEPELEPEPAAEADLESEPEPVPIPDVDEAETGTVHRRRRFGRRRRESPQAEAQPDAPKHVRVLPPRETSVAEAELPPWERGFDDTEERR
jgi:hypothetical protein